jgi:hypothetical protein
LVGCPSSEWYQPIWLAKTLLINAGAFCICYEERGQPTDFFQNNDFFCRSYMGGGRYSKTFILTALQLHSFKQPSSAQFNCNGISYMQQQWLC